MSLLSYYPKNLKAHGWGWHRDNAAAAAVKGFLKGERGEGTDQEPLLRKGGLYPTLPTEDDTVFSTGMRLYPALPAEEYESGAVEEVIEEVCAAVNVDAVWIEGQKGMNTDLPSKSRTNECPASIKKLMDCLKEYPYKRYLGYCDVYVQDLKKCLEAARKERQRANAEDSRKRNAAIRSRIARKEAEKRSRKKNEGTK